MAWLLGKAKAAAAKAKAAVSNAAESAKDYMNSEPWDVHIARLASQSNPPATCDPVSPRGTPIRHDSHTYYFSEVMAPIAPAPSPSLCAPAAFRLPLFQGTNAWSGSWRHRRSSSSQRYARRSNAGRTAPPAPRTARSGTGAPTVTSRRRGSTERRAYPATVSTCDLGRTTTSAGVRRRRPTRCMRRSTGWSSEQTATPGS